MPDDVQRLIRSGHLDVGYYLGTPNKTFHRLTLTQFTYCVLAPSAWNSRVSGKDWPALAKLPWIWTPPESAHHRLFGKTFAQCKATPNKVASVALPEAHAHCLVISDTVDLSTQLSFITLDKRKNEAVTVAVLAILKTIWGN